MVIHDLDLSPLNSHTYKKLVVAAAKITRGIAMPNWVDIDEGAAEKIFTRLWEDNEQPLEFCPMFSAITSGNTYIAEWLGILCRNLKYYKQLHDLDYKNEFILDMLNQEIIWRNAVPKGYKILMVRVPRVVAIHWRTHRSIKLMMETGRKGNNKIEFDFDDLTPEQIDWAEELQQEILKTKDSVNLPNTQLSMFLSQHRMVWCIIAGTVEGELGLNAMLQKRLHKKVQGITKRYSEELYNYLNK